MKKLFNLAIIALFIIALGLIALLVARPILANIALERPADARLLFIGNSFTNNHQLDQLVAKLVSELEAEKENVFATRVAPGGYKISDHLRDVENASGNPRLRRLLVSGSEQARDWDLIVIQEQSQLPGFGGQTVTGAPQLHQYTGAAGDVVMLMMTWGYADGDSTNQSLYPNYLTMQDKLTWGYNGMASRMSGNGRQVYIAPAGSGFQLVYQDVQQSGQDPLAANSLFRQLYAADGKHPSLAGSYLAACIITAAYTGKALADTDWKPGELDAEIAAYLRQVADRVVFGNAFPRRDYPWQQ